MKLRNYLDKKGLKLTFFARKLGITHSCLLRLMRREHDMRLSVACRIVRETDGEVSFLDLIPKAILEKTVKHKDTKQAKESDNDTANQPELCVFAEG